MHTRDDDETVADLVARDIRAIDVFEAFDIDFCCRGQVLLAEAARAAGADLDAVHRALTALEHAPPDDDPIVCWSMSRLIDHVVDFHHRYVRVTLPLMAADLASLQQSHGDHYPELSKASRVLAELSAALLRHLAKEEHILFPYIRELEECGGRTRSPFGTIDNPIRMMEREHIEAAEHLRQIRSVFAQYAVLAGGHTDYQAAMQRVREFERDLHRHVHIENNVLFPRAQECERILWPN